MKKLVILCDMDGIVVNLLPYWLKKIEDSTGVSVTPEQIRRWDMHKCEGLQALDPNQIYRFLSKPKFFAEAPPVPGGPAGLKRLHDNGHRVMILSSPSGGVSAKEKFEWLGEYMPWLPTKQIILANEKTLVCGDVLIDDHPGTLVDYGKRWSQAYVCGIQYPYNTGLGDGVTLFSDYRDTKTAWTNIVAAIEAVSVASQSYTEMLK